MLNAREGEWRKRLGVASLRFEGQTEFEHLGVRLFVLGAGEPIGMYHWESGQEDFLVLRGEAVLIVEGQERRLRAWDFVHCPPGTNHMIVGAGNEPCVLVAVGARLHQGPWGGFTSDEVAARYRASVVRDTTDPAEAYAGVPRSRPLRYKPNWLP